MKIDMEKFSEKMLLGRHLLAEQRPEWPSSNKPFNFEAFEKESMEREALEIQAINKLPQSFSIIEKMAVAQGIGFDFHRGQISVGDDACECCGLPTSVCGYIESLTSHLNLDKERIMAGVLDAYQRDKENYLEIMFSIADDKELTDAEKIFIGYGVGRVTIGIQNWGVCPDCGSHSIEDITKPNMVCAYKCKNCGKKLKHEDLGLHERQGMADIIKACQQMNKEGNK